MIDIKTLDDTRDMGHGGRRAGAGRKKGFAALEAETARVYMARRLAESIEPIVDKLISQATNGDVRAIRELFDRALGKAPQGIQLTNGMGQPIVFQIPAEIAEKHAISTSLEDSSLA